MALPFFADHCVSGTIIQLLRNAGHNVVRLRDHLPVDSPDSAVIAMAEELDNILLSINGDFADIVAYPPADYAGIICLQLRNHPEAIPQLIQRLCDYCELHTERDHYRGKLLVVEVHRIRVR